MDKKKIVYGAVALVVLVITWAVLTVPKPPSAEEVEKAAKKVMEYGQQTITEEKNGKRVWDLSTEKSKVEMSSNNAEFFNITGHFYTEDGKILEVKAPHGTYDAKTRAVLLDGNIKATTSDGVVLTAEKLGWDAKKNALAAAGKAKLVKENVTAEGDFIGTYDHFEEFIIYGHAHLTRKNGK